MKLKKLFKKRPLKGTEKSELFTQLSRLSKKESSNNFYGYILHGASCSGKSYILKKARLEFPEIAYIDIDKSKYWQPNPPIEIHKTFYRWYEEWSKLNDPKCRDLIENINASSDSIKYTKILLIRACYNRITFASTCGNLPKPDDKFYTFVLNCFNTKISHVLIVPPKNKFVEQVYMRGKKRIDRLDELLRQYEGRKREKDKYDEIVIDNIDIAKFIKKVGSFC